MAQVNERVIPRNNRLGETTLPKGFFLFPTPQNGNVAISKPDLSDPRAPPNQIE
jgi:hypothetical protein